MKRFFSFLCVIGMTILCSVSAVALPDKSGAMKRSKDYEIYQVVVTAYRKYVAELTEFQTQYTATKRFAEAKRIQEEIQRNIGYVRQIGKSYQFIFSRQTALPKECNAFREKRNFAVKDAVREILNSYVAKLKTEQSVYLKSRDLPRAKAVQEEIQRMTDQLKRLEGMGKVFVKKIPRDAKSYGGHRYKVYSGKVTWHEAKFRCEELGGHLAIVGKSAENSFLAKYLGETSLRSNAVFIGATDEVKEGNWLWVNGKKMDYQKWHKGVKNKNGGPDYLVIQRWGDWSPSGKNTSSYVNGWICEWE